MTWYLWVFVCFFGAAMFGLGCIFARSSLKKRGEGKMLSNKHTEAVLAIFFTVIAIAVAVDTIHLQFQFNKYIKNQTACNSAILRVNDRTALQRAKVDQAAAEYDIAFQAWAMVFTTRPLAPADDPAYLNMQSAVAKVTKERLEMLKVYAENPIPNCQ